MKIAAVGLDRIALERNLSHAARDGRDEYALIYVTNGSMSVDQMRRNAVVEPGYFVLADHTSPWCFRLSATYGAGVLIIPRPLLDARLPDISRIIAKPILAESGLAKIAVSYLRGMCEMTVAPAVGRDNNVAVSALDLLATVFEDAFIGVGFKSGQEGKLEQVKAYLRRNLEDADLNIDAIAHHQGLTPRTLNRLFARDGTSPMRWLWEERLRASYRFLVEARVRTVTEAAFMCGFSDVSHFSRTFKRAYRVSPSALLRRVD